MRRQVLSGVSFLHVQLGLQHNNLATHTVYVTPAGACRSPPAPRPPPPGPPPPAP